MIRRRPPQRADRLLAAVLPEGLVGSTIIGDLHQEYEERSENSWAGALWLWYWRQTLSLLTRYGWQRITGRGSGYHRMLTSIPVCETTQPLFAGLLQDARYALRMLRKSALVSGVAVATMALGIGFTLFTFSLVYGSILRGLPVPDDERLVMITADNPTHGQQDVFLWYSDMLRLRELDEFEHLGALNQGSVNLAGDGRAPERYLGAYVSPGLLRDLGVAPLRGRTFRPQDQQPGAAGTVIIGYQVWQHRFGAEPGVVGRSIRVNGHSAQIIAIMPEGFGFPFAQDVWVPLRRPVGTDGRRVQRVSIVGRLAPGVSFQAANAASRARIERFEATHPLEPQGFVPHVRRYEYVFMPPQIRAVLGLMLGGVLGVLLIACANVAHLLLARAATRVREIAVRSALGAGRGRLIRQLLLESTLLAVVGGVIGILLAKVATDRYVVAISSIPKPYWLDMRLDLAPLLFAAASIGATALLAGTLPAVRASGIRPTDLIRGQQHGASSLRIGRLSGVLVVGQLAVSSTLLVAAGLMIRSVINVSTTHLGFRTAGIVTGRVSLFESDYPRPIDRQQFFARLIERLRQEPGFEEATLATALPGTQTWQARVEVEGKAYAGPADRPLVHHTGIGTQFFATFGVGIRRGREFTAAEMTRGAEPTVIVNDSFARRYLPPNDPLGHRIRLRRQKPGPWMRVVGVVPDLHIGAGVGGLAGDDRPREQIYLPRPLSDTTFAIIAVRTSVPVPESTRRLRSIVAASDPNLPVYSVRTLDRAMQDHTWAFGLFARLFGALAAVALFLAAVGLYGIVSFSVTQRRREMGIRLALGARPRDLLWLVLATGARRVGAGLLLGLSAGALVARPLTAVTYGVTPGDPAVYVAIAITALGTGLVATLAPARWALHVSPNRVLRSE